MKTTVAAPPPRNIAQEAQQTQQAQVQAAGPQFDAYAEFAPKYDQVDLQRFRDALGLGGDATIRDINSVLTQDAMDQTTRSNRILREADLRDAQELGGQANQVSRLANPELYGALDRLTGAAGANAGAGVFEQQAGRMAQGGSPMFGGSGPLMAELERQAASDLARGGELSAQEQRDVLNPVANRFAASGLGRSNITAATAALGLDSARRARMNERRSFAGAVDAQGFGQRLGTADFNRTSRSQQFGQLMGLGAAQDARNQAAFGQLATAAQGRMATYQDPFMAILGRQSSNIGTNAGLAGMGQGVTGQNAGIRNNFDPFNAYASDLYNTNFNAQMNANVATANNRAALIGSLLGAAGTAAGGYLGRPPCWVARAVYGEHDVRWTMFREWLLVAAPAWFRNLYIKHGERFAAWVANKPRIKGLIRLWMDARIESYYGA